MWLAAGVLLMVIELATPSGFFVMFFGLGALTVGTLMRLGFVESLWLEWLLFTVTSLAYVLLFRDKMRKHMQPAASEEVDSLVGELATPRERIPAGQVGRVELRGSLWSARNDSPASIEPGLRCRVIRVDGLLLFVRPE
jgi:inner membrane protein